MAKKRYENYDSPSYRNSLKDLIKWRIERSKKRKDYSEIPQSENKLVNYLEKNRTDTSVTWIGHSSFLLQLNGINILTDPVYSNQMGFTKRLSKPGLKITELPSIDLICISHGHYDHLDFKTIRHFPKSTLFLVPIGLKQKFATRGYTNVIEMNWWDTKNLFGLDITFVPAQHWTKRTLFDTNKSHWGGFVYETPDDCLYYAGDSAYFSGFKEIGKRFEINIALLPIGAYEPEWFMKHDHMSPEEAVKVFLELKAKLFIPMHYGTFRLADDTPKEALDRLVDEWQKLNIPVEKLKIARLGETILPSHIQKTKEEVYL